jgi:hypothetical protein
MSRSTFVSRPGHPQSVIGFPYIRSTQSTTSAVLSAASHTVPPAPKTADHHIQYLYNEIGVSTRAAALRAMQHAVVR